MGWRNPTNCKSVPNLRSSVMLPIPLSRFTPPTPELVLATNPQLASSPIAASPSFKLDGYAVMSPLSTDDVGSCKSPTSRPNFKIADASPKSKEGVTTLMIRDLAEACFFGDFWASFSVGGGLSGRFCGPFFVFGGTFKNVVFSRLLPEDWLEQPNSGFLVAFWALGPRVRYLCLRSRFPCMPTFGALPTSGNIGQFFFFSRTAPCTECPKDFSSQFEQPKNPHWSKGINTWPVVSTGKLDFQSTFKTGATKATSALILQGTLKLQAIHVLSYTRTAFFVFGTLQASAACLGHLPTNLSQSEFLSELNNMGHLAELSLTLVFLGCLEDSYEGKTWDGQCLMYSNIHGKTMSNSLTPMNHQFTQGLLEHRW